MLKLFGKLFFIWGLLFIIVQGQRNFNQNQQNDELRNELEEIRSMVENIQSLEANQNRPTPTSSGRLRAAASSTSDHSHSATPTAHSNSAHSESHDTHSTLKPKHADRDSNDSEGESEHGKSSHAKPTESGFTSEPLGSAILFVVALITTSFNLGACSFLLYKIYKVGKHVGFHMSLRVVMYSVVADMLVGLFFTISIIYSTLFHELIEGTSCMLIGYIINTLTAADMLLIAYTAVNTYLEIVHQKDILRGHRDWLLLLVCLGLPTIISTILAQYHAFGPETYWCLIDEETPAGVASSVGILVLHSLVSIVVGIAYLLLRRYQKKTPNVANPHNSLLVPIPKQHLDNLRNIETQQVFIGSQRQPEHRSPYMKHAHRRSVVSVDYAQMKLSTHLAIHLIQYTPAAIHLLCVLLEYRFSWLFTMAIIFTNLSGVFQLINYMHHEKVKKKHYDSFTSSRSSDEPKEDPTSITVQAENTPGNFPPQVYVNGHRPQSQSLSHSPMQMKKSTESRRGSILETVVDKVKKVTSRESGRGYAHIINQLEGGQNNADRHLTLDPHYSLTAPAHMRYSSHPIQSSPLAYSNDDQTEQSDTPRQKRNGYHHHQS
ncbi:hypothetical protein CONCODRAFT_68677 [Conidiobolus coronatus NRRL 28638]|uniref:G-protein coupled receptors family 1 profile domain-containing protein n=1 Tax=Conidiobolus coronatus (strain ATCC 28846 / CBS 209.66 / NRRL 28638) TaxID=796925 RepID=A0A137PDB2_CONC2|nr:hypothetical protein CONCODRAFT_68677 [Conidiobolus coronatus NRRL 28638]|eukprot:KXN72931.1 hypothetical protein CONCODRAFT_68677 [Conidiobolus coronatus NRRL 28638]